MENVMSKPLASAALSRRHFRIGDIQIRTRTSSVNVQMSELHRKRLQDLRFDSANFVVVALIISKSNPRSFTSTRSADTMAVITFTIRDSKTLSSNCICWGAESKIKDYYRKYRIGDIIDIISPQVTPISRSGKQFHPETSTPFALTVNDGSASIEPHMFDTILATELRLLAQQPMKPVSQALNLADLNASIAHNAGQFVDLFVAVKMCKPVRKIKAKTTGEELQCIEVIVVDKSYPVGMSFSIWHQEWIERAEKCWVADGTVLYLLDVRLDYSAYYKRPVLCYSSKTIILENILVKEAQPLLQFAATVCLNSSDWSPQSFPNPETITLPMTVKQIYDRIYGIIQDDSEFFTAAIYAVVTRFDLDGCFSSVSKKCQNCKRIAPLHQQVCGLDQCQMEISFDGSGHNRFDYFFNINLHLTDHTGTLIECRLMNNFAEKILNVTTEEYVEMSISKRTEFKWRFLMERVCVKLIVKKKSTVRKNLSVVVLDMKVIELDDVVGKMLVY